MKIERKRTEGFVREVKQEDRNGTPVGIVAGYIATWDLDRGDYTGVRDRFVRGAFSDSIKEHMQKRRQIRLKDHHGRTVGGFPIEHVKEDDKGLYGVGEINLDVQQGREAFALAKQGVLSDFSIGFSVIDQTTDHAIKTRTITKAVIWEGSIVDEPMNEKANIMQVKSAAWPEFGVTDTDAPWNETAALQRVREFTGSEETPSDDYKNYFLWHDVQAPADLASYKMLIGDIADGHPCVSTLAVKAAAKSVLTEDALSESDCALLREKISNHCASVSVDNPFDEDTELKYHSVEDIKEWTVRDIEDALRTGARFSKAAAKAVISKIADPVIQAPAPVLPAALDAGVMEKVNADLKSILSLIQR